MIVLRRTTPRHDGARYYAKPAPVQGSVEHAREFETMADAEAERTTLREPWLWQVIDVKEAAALDAGETAQLKRHVERAKWEATRRRPLFAALMAIGATGMAVPPGMRR